MNMNNLKMVIDNCNIENIRKIIKIYGIVSLNDFSEWNYKNNFDDFIQYITAKHNILNNDDLLFDLYCYDYYENEKQYFMIIHYFNHNDYDLLCMVDFDVAETEINYIDNNHILKTL